MSYLLKCQEDGLQKEKTIQLEELNKNSKKYLNIQENNGNEPVLFCDCNDKLIPMLLTKHEPTPHFQTKSASDKGKHYKFCRHFIDETSKNTYKPAITTNDDGIEIAHISWDKDEDALVDQIDSGYKNRNSFQYNNCNRVIQGKMTFDAFIKYKNMQYFKINQYTNKIVDLGIYNSKLFGWIENSYIGKEQVKNLSKGKFVYGIVNDIKEIGKEKCLISMDKCCIYCKKEVYDKAKKRFENTYNHLVMDSIINNTLDNTWNDYYVVFYGFKDTNLKYPICKLMGFMLVNKYGLFCESINEAKMFNLICDYLFQGNLKEKYVVYKPTEPENDYSNPNFISDGVIQTREKKEKVVVEVFGRQEEDYIERKRQKITTCKSDAIFWDVFDLNSWAECENRLKKIII